MSTILDTLNAKATMPSWATVPERWDLDVDGTARRDAHGLSRTVACAVDPSGSIWESAQATVRPAATQEVDNDVRTLVCVQLTVGPRDGVPVHDLHLSASAARELARALLEVADEIEQS